MPVELINGEETSTSETAWTTVVEAKIPDTISKVLIWLKEQDVNDLIYRVQCSVESTFSAGLNQTLFDKNHNNAFHLDKNQSSKQTLADPYPYLRVQIKSSLAKAHGTALVHILGSATAGGGSLDVRESSKFDEIKSVLVNQPGVAYAQSVNALCLIAPEHEGHHLEVMGVYLSTKAAGDFYLVVANLGVAAGSTTDNTFDLIGVRGTDIADTSDVVWAAFLANTSKGGTEGAYEMELNAGYEIYLIAPDVDYNLHITYREHQQE